MHSLSSRELIIKCVFVCAHRFHSNTEANLKIVSPLPIGLSSFFDTPLPSFLPSFLPSLLLLDHSYHTTIWSQAKIHTHAIPLLLLLLLLFMDVISDSLRLEFICLQKKVCVCEPVCLCVYVLYTRYWKEIKPNT